MTGQSWGAVKNNDKWLGLVFGTEKPDVKLCSVAELNLGAGADPSLSTRQVCMRQDLSSHSDEY